jgi:hypothetical protein
VKLDVISVQAQQAPSSYDRIKQAIEGLVEQASPARRPENPWFYRADNSELPEAF